MKRIAAFVQADHKSQDWTHTSPTTGGNAGSVGEAITSTRSNARLLQPQWVDPTAALVCVIVDISGSLRSLDLGEIELATTFSAG